MEELKKTNVKLLEQLKEYSLELDALIDENAIKTEMIERKEIIVRNKKCDHAP